MRRRAKSRSRRSLPALDGLEPRLFLSRLTGIDVSQFQGTMNWTTAASRGLSFALIRASRSDTLPDTQLANNMNATTGAKAKGLVVGVYHRACPFTYPNESGPFRDPVTDADSFIASGGAYMGTGYIRPIVDVEDGLSLNTTPVNGYTLKTWVVAFINRIKQANGVTPLVYSNSSTASGYLDSTTVAATPDFWVANWTSTTYGDPVNGSGNPPTSPWPTWRFWQYSSTPNGLASYYGAGSGNDIDLDVFNGSDINLLKQNFVIGAAAMPSAPSPANAATNVNPVGLTFDWANSANAVAYDLYLDNMSTPLASDLTVSQWTSNIYIAGGAHTWKVVAKGSTSDDDTWTEASWTFSAQNIPAPGAFTLTNPPNGGTDNNPVPSFTWTASSNATTYDFYLGSGQTPTVSGLTTTSWGGLNPAAPDKSYTWHVVARGNGSTSSAASTFIRDTTSPTATLGTQKPATGEVYLDFTVTYADATTSVDVSTFDNSDVTVTGPNGYSEVATLAKIDINTNGTPRVATYRIPAPGGTWNDADNGSYTVSQVAFAIQDVAHNYRPAESIGTIEVGGLGVAWTSGTVLNIIFDGTVVPVLLSTNGSDISVTKNGNTNTFAGITRISVVGSSADDRLQINAPLTPTLDFAASSGNDLVEVIGGAYTFANDISTPSLSIGIYVASGASAIFDTTQRLRSLSVDGTARMSAGGDKVLRLGNLAVAGQLNLADNDLIYDYAGESPMGDSSAAPGTVSAMIIAGRAGGSWSGGGIVTDRPAAQGALASTTLGISEARDALGISDAQTALFDGETVDATTVLVKYTYNGDANLSGRIDGDDFFRIDSNFAASGAIAWHKGDFDFNGKLNADDYFLLDAIYPRQGDVIL